MKRRVKTLDSGEWPRRQAIASPLVVIQSIKTEWTKASRGALGASSRNRVPLALPIPAPAASPGQPAYIIHETIWSERNGFQSPIISEMKMQPFGDPWLERCLRVETAEAAGQTVARVIYQYDYSGGAPERRFVTGSGSLGPLRAQVGQLELDQWVRVRHNGRWGHYRGWSYGAWTWNVGLWTTFQADVFLESEPIRLYDQLAILR